MKTLTPRTSTLPSRTTSAASRPSRTSTRPWPTLSEHGLYKMLRRLPFPLFHHQGTFKPLPYAAVRFRYLCPTRGLNRSFRGWGVHRKRVFGGDFHSVGKKSAFFRPFLRFFLAFSVSLGYSPLRPGFFSENKGVASSVPASIASRPALAQPGRKVNSGG